MVWTEREIRWIKDYAARAAIAAIDAQAPQAAPLDVDHLPGTSGDSINDAMAWAAQAAPLGAPTHELKTDPEVFQAVCTGRKTYEIRKNDRDFGVGVLSIARATPPAVQAQSVEQPNLACKSVQKRLATQRGVQALTDAWRKLYRRAVNEANGLTNYVDDRPELRRAERNLTAIEAEARSLDAAMAGAAAQGGEHG